MRRILSAVAVALILLALWAWTRRGASLVRAFLDWQASR